MGRVAKIISYLVIWLVDSPVWYRAKCTYLQLIERSFSSPCSWRMLIVPAFWLNLQSRHRSQLGEFVY